jgi:hypothetical protein
MDTPLTIAIINLFRAGNVVTISQLTAQLVQEPAFRLVGTSEVRSIVVGLERDKLVRRSLDGGIMRFQWNRAPSRGRR